MLSHYVKVLCLYDILKGTGQEMEILSVEHCAILILIRFCFGQTEPDKLYFN